MNDQKGMPMDKAEAFVKEIVVKAAAQVYLDRQAFRTHPEGYQDDDGHWHLADEEKQKCCETITGPFLFNNHARSITHIACLFGVETKEIQDAILRMTD